MAATRLGSASAESQHNEPKNSCKTKSNEALNKTETPSRDSPTPFEKLYYDIELAQTEEYLQYMAKFVDPVS